MCLESRNQRADTIFKSICSFDFSLDLISEKYLSTKRCSQYIMCLVMVGCDSICCLTSQGDQILSVHILTTLDYFGLFFKAWNHSGI